MILRGHRTARMVLATIRDLASMAHQAEEANDDLTAIGLMEELEVREKNFPGATDLFRMEYQDLMKRAHSAGAERGE